MSGESNAAILTAPAPAGQYQSVGGTFVATTTNAPQMTFAWTAQVVATSSQTAIQVTVNYGGGTAENNQQQVQIPWGWTSPVAIPGGQNPAISVNGSVSALYTSDASALVTFTGNMIYPGTNNITCTGAIVAACIAQD